ncbi:C-type lectin domain family 6 member A-like [Herpailurus yagouaroundi]|uniref:C-type lectin domain family 6 member A-like n=1 Tax=Herpailurus yagouaroundi TaxID=1608482 RepID=UPI001AD6C8DD|nr:C-type lectin domain family 6 member A-like [Puma yagouaroundi]
MWGTSFRMTETPWDSSSGFFIALSFLKIFTSWLLDNCFCLAGLTEKAVWRSQVRFWSVAVISIALLSACFIVSCVVTYHLTYGKTGQRLSELHTRHSGLTCFREGTSMRGKVLQCLTRLSLFSERGPGQVQHWFIPFFFSVIAICMPSISFITGQCESWNMVQDEIALTVKHSPVFFMQNFLVQQLNESLSYFLGLSDTQGNDNWQWIDQTPYKENVRVWHQNEPNFSAEECASIVFWENRGWAWSDVFCDTKRNSVCEMRKI